MHVTLSCFVLRGYACAHAYTHVRHGWSPRTYISIRTSGTVRNTFETRSEVRSRRRPSSATADPRYPGTANNWKRRQSSRYSWQRNRSSQHEERAISNRSRYRWDGNRQPRTRVYSHTPSHTAGKTTRPVIDLQRSTVSTFRYNLLRDAKKFYACDVSHRISYATLWLIRGSTFIFEMTKFNVIG